MNVKLSPMGVAASAVLLVGVTGCGRAVHDDRPNGTRPPTEVHLSAVATKQGFTISPKSIGAGPANILVSNQTGSDLQPVLVSSTDNQTVVTSRYPVAPGQTAVLAVELKPNQSYKLGSEGDDLESKSVKSFTLKVTGMRKSSDDELLLP